jgi:hypothetical protein
MDIVTLELFDVTVSEAIRETARALDQHPGLPLRILLGGDGMVRHNVVRLLERSGHAAQPQPEGAHWRIDIAGLPGAAQLPAPAAMRPLAPTAPAVDAPPQGLSQPACRPLLLTRSRLGSGTPVGQDAGRRLLLGVLDNLDPAVPWLGLALEGLELLEDDQALALLERLRARGVRVRISRDSQLFPSEWGERFELLEDSHWQRLAGRGELTII